MHPRESRHTWHVAMDVIDMAVPPGWGWSVGREGALSLGRRYIAEGFGVFADRQPPRTGSVENPSKITIT